MRKFVFCFVAYPKYATKVIKGQVYYSSPEWVAFRQYVESKTQLQIELEEKFNEGEYPFYLEELQNFMEFSPNLSQERIAFFAGYQAAPKAR